MIRLQEAISQGAYLLDLEARDIASIFRQTLEHLIEQGLLDAERRDEVQAALISIIFIFAAAEALVAYLHDAHQERIDHDVAFLSLLLALGTFYVAMSLSRFRRSRYLQPGMREFLADFGPAIAVMTMVAVALMFPKVQLEPLTTHKSFQPT